MKSRSNKTGRRDPFELQYTCNQGECNFYEQYNDDTELTMTERIRNHEQHDKSSITFTFINSHNFCLIN